MAMPRPITVSLLLLLSGLMLPASAAAQATGPRVKFDIDGYYRMRGNLFVNLFDKDFPKDGARDVSVWYVNGGVESIPEEYETDWDTRFPINLIGHGTIGAACRAW